MRLAILKRQPLNSLPSVVAAWLAEIPSERTAREYAAVVRRFAEIVPPHDAAPAHVHAFTYGAGPGDKPPSPSTVNVRLAALASFYGFLERMGMIANNPVDKVKRNRLPRPVPRGLSLAEIKSLLGAIPDTEAGRRDRLIILGILLTGLRRSEIMGMRLANLSRDAESGRTFYRLKVKGGAIRHRELPAPIAEGIAEIAEATADNLWAVSGQTFYLNLARYARRAKIPGLTPHVLRHTAAKLRRDAGQSIEDVSALLGHASISTTARYLARLEGQSDDGWQAVAEALGLT